MLCRTLCERLEDLSLVFVVSSHKLFMELLKEEERKVLVEQMRKRSATINLSAKPLPSFYDIPGTVCVWTLPVAHFSMWTSLYDCDFMHFPFKASASVSIGQLEQQLILSLEPRRIRQILIELHGMAERPFWRVNSKVRGQQTEINSSANIEDIQYFVFYCYTLDIK